MDRTAAPEPSSKRPILVLALVSFAVLSPVLFIGLPIGYDLPHHFQCAMTYAESIKAGDLYPSWSANRNFGYGGMETRLYPPISHYTLALSYLATNDWHLAAWLTLFFFTFIGAYGVYLWANEYVTPWHAAFAGCLFAVMPYHLNQIYNTFFFAEYAGTALLPFTFVFISRIARRGSPADVIGLGVSFAALILTHLPLTVIGSVCFAVYALSKLRRDNFVPFSSKLAAGGAVGLAASSFFWIKVIQERDYLAKTLIYSDDWLDYRLHFLLTPVQSYDGYMPLEVFQNATSFYDLMLLCGVVLAVTFLIALAISGRQQLGRIFPAMAVFLTACFLAIPLSRPLWDRISVLQEVQFPWRWLAIVCVVSPVIAAGGVAPVVSWYRSAMRPFALIAGGVVMAVVTFSVMQIMRPAPIMPREEVAAKMTEIRQKEGATFWWTEWTRKEAFTVSDRVTAAGRATDIVNWASTTKEFEVAPGIATDARIALLYYPLWKANVNGQAVDTHRADDGALTVPVPSDHARVRLEFRETTSATIARYTSLLTATILLGIGLVVLGRRWTGSFSKRDRDEPDHISPPHLSPVFAEHE